MLTEMQY